MQLHKGRIEDMMTDFKDTSLAGNPSARANRQKTEKYDVVVCGGGLAGFCAAVASARQGVRTCLVQDRPVFEGDSSSEVRVTPHGVAAFHVYAKETGLISELLIEERAHNHETVFENGWTNSVWDMTMYDMAQRTENLTFYLNTTILDVRMANARKIASVVGYVLKRRIWATRCHSPRPIGLRSLIIRTFSINRVEIPI
ncbi:FAD-dependent oxidoreductase [Paenibacillus sp. 2RAB27]|uniref:FAD-dependent oxidoreductase n=1 Tax=Paenibacillus sp. 2RAB27 TaxID=3232991 RepID=UPI003F9D1F00